MATGTVRTAVLESLGALAGSRTDSETLRYEALALLGRALPIDGWAWAVSDPASQLAASAVARHPLESSMLGMLSCEEDPHEINRRVDLAASRLPAAALGLSTGGEPDRSLRWRLFMSDSGIGDELRMVFVDRGGCWGYLDLYTSGARCFDEDDLAMAAATVRPLCGALRRTSVAGTSEPAGDDRRELGMLIVDRHLGIRARTGPVAQWLPQLYASDGMPLPCAVVTAVARAAATPQDARRTIRQRTKDGSWATVRADALDTGEIAVAIAPSSRAEVLDLIARAGARIPREREVLALLQQGNDNKQIAARLFISTTTAHDHVQAILRKTGFSGRQALLCAA